MSTRNSTPPPYAPAPRDDRSGPKIAPRALIPTNFSADDLKFPGDDARPDLTDLYVFPDTRAESLPAWCAGTGSGGGGLTPR